MFAYAGELAAISYRKGDSWLDSQSRVLREMPALLFRVP